jgi:tryptophan-rich sensory protein
VLYVFMAIAAWLVWRKAGFAGATLALGCYLLQLVLNAAWSWLFFGQQSIGGALIDIVILWLAILATALLFLRHSRTARALFVPYLA